jgi:hypothetical protein
MSARSDLTGFAALLGESFASRVDQLTHVIQDAHFPSLGTYKERLLAETIRKYLPKSVEVGTGFVLFPHEHDSPPGGFSNFDHLNRSAFAVSRQCDIVVFDSSSFPPVFRDGDFVVLRPESVKAVIEVKGSLSIPETRSMVDAFIDFGRKWRSTQLFYRSHYQKVSKAPMLACMAWSIGKNGRGNPITNPLRIRQAIVSYYASAVARTELDDFPLLDKLLIYGEAEISLVYGNDDKELTATPLHLGWYSSDGRFQRYDKDGNLYRDRDRTVASLLAGLHAATGWDTFNRFFSYVDEVSHEKKIPHDHHGFEWCWRDLEHVQRL